jgi:hypothetical protein
MSQSPLEETRSANRNCLWLCQALVGGRVYEVRSRHGAARELARLLRDAGVPDQEVRVYSAGLAGHAAFASLYRMADYTLEENAQTPLRRRRHRPAQDAQEGVRTGDLSGEAAEAAITEPDQPKNLREGVISHAA